LQGVNWATRRKPVGRKSAAADLGPGSDRAPDEVRLEPDDRVAPAHFAAFDRFEQKAHRPAAGDFQKGRDRRFKISDQGRPHDLRLAGRIARGKRRSRRLDLHI